MKTREEIEAQVRSENPTSDGNGPGHPDYEALIEKWTDIAFDAQIPPVPEAVTPRQFRLAMLQSGISPGQIKTLIGKDEAALIEWEYASEIRRDHPLVTALSSNLGKTDAEVDDLFRAASDL